MNALNQIIDRYTIRYDKKIKAICRPLQEYLDISGFIYYKIKSDGTLVTISSRAEQLDFYYQEKLYLDNPYLVHPELLNSGTVLTATTQDLRYLETVSQSKKRFDMDNTFLMVEKGEGVVEGFLYATFGGHPLGTSLYGNNFTLLQKFNRFFVKEAQPILGKMEADGYNIKAVKNDKFFQRSDTLPLGSGNAATKQFLDAILPLSRQEKRCLDLFRKGHSAQATAAIMGLSKRTVEHYFESIKNKLGCYSKWELLSL